MSTNIINEDDVNYLAQQSSSDLNLILAGMTTLMEENRNMVYLIENQNWFQRMSNTILGKNKMTQAEIEQNHDKINLYISQAMGELFNRNCIDHEIILGLGNKINELYESQIEIKMMIGAFAKKLNEKIDSIDNFHMLVAEINQGQYDCSNSFLSISKIMSQLDLRTVQDHRKMDILVRALEEQNIIGRQGLLFSEMLEGILSVNENEAGVLAIFFNSIRNEYIAEITEKVIYSYYMMPEKMRKMKSKHSVVETILKANDIALDYEISSYEMCMTLIEAYANNIIEVAIEDAKNEEEEKIKCIQKYIKDAMNLMEILKNMGKTWNANHGEMNTHETRKDYSEFMNNVAEVLNENSYIGNSIMNSLNNITFLAQKLFAKYSDIKINKLPMDAMGQSDETLIVNANVALENINCVSEEDNKFETVAEHLKNYISFALGQIIVAQLSRQKSEIFIMN